MAKFKLVWENNPDTPITASNLSKIIQDYNSDNIIYFDNNDFIENADNKLKIKANSRFVTTKQPTVAYFGFNDSLVSHNSKYSANTAININYRKETPLSIGKSIALETSTINEILNGDFSDGLNNWTPTNSGGGNVSISTDGLYGNCVLLSTSSAISQAKIEQTINFPPVPDDDDNPNVSISFYYKSDKDLNFLIIGKHDSSQPVYWNNSPSGLRWEVNSSVSLITLSPTSDWKRVEIKNIRTNTLWSSTNDYNNLKLSIYTTQSNAQSYIDAVQIEKKAYCSTFTPSSRGESILKYGNDMIRIEKGLIDLEFMPKFFNSEKNVLFRVEMTQQYNPIQSRYYNDAMRLELGSSAISFFIYDATTQTEKQLSKSMTSMAFNDLIDNWQRLIILWEQSQIKLSLNGEDLISLNQEYTTIDSSLLGLIELGGSGAQKFEGLLSSLKFNLFTKTNDAVKLDSQKESKPDNNEYKVFESSNDSIVIDSSYLDISSSFSPLTEYYIYLVDCEGEEEEIDIVVSSNAITPNNTCKFFSNKIGGFKTDSSGNIVVSSLWDIKTKSNTTIMTERLIIHGKDSQTNNIEFRTTPYGDNSDAKFNIPVYITNHLYGKVGSTDFLDIHPSGYLTVDNLKLDSNSITSIGMNDLTLTSPSGRKVEINSDNIDLNAGTGDIHLDNLRVKNNQIKSFSGNTTLANDTISSEVIINSYSGISRIIGNEHVNQANNIIIQPLTTTQINSGSTPTYIDNILFNDNVISSKSTKNLTFESSGIIEINSDARFNSLLRFSDINGKKIILNDILDKPEIGTQSSSVYFRSNDHFVWFRKGDYNSTFGQAGTGGTALAFLTGNNTSPPVTVDAYSRFYAGRVYNAVWNDIAECWNKAPNYEFEYGQVVVQTENGVRPSKKRAEKATIGVISNTYGYLLNDDKFNDLKTSKVVPIGIAGRVKIKLEGRAEIGDEVVSYYDGMAIKASWFEKLFLRDRIIGMIDSIKDGYKIKIK